MCVLRQGKQFRNSCRHTSFIAWQSRVLIKNKTKQNKRGVNTKEQIKQIAAWSNGMMKWVCAGSGSQHLCCLEKETQT